MSFKLSSTSVHDGLVDGSAGIALSSRSFIAATDEFNLIRRFNIDGSREVVTLLDLDQQVPWYPSIAKKTGNGFKESDIESAARVGDTIYWIGSHGADAKGGEEKSRQVFFSTTLEIDGENMALVPSGKVFQGLLADLLDAPPLRKYQLELSARISPKTGGKNGVPGGLNIESLCTAEDGATLLIGFRNPIPDGKALLIPLENACEIVMEANKTRAKFGPPVELDLHGLGIRDMVWWRGRYLILAGHFGSHLDDTGRPLPGTPASQLFLWNGGNDQPFMILENQLDALNPEALVVFPDDRVMILSDDGEFGDKGTKENPTGKFRAVWLEEGQ